VKEILLLANLWAEKHGASSSPDLTGVLLFFLWPDGTCSRYYLNRFPDHKGSNQRAVIKIRPFVCESCGGAVKPGIYLRTIQSLQNGFYRVKSCINRRDNVYTVQSCLLREKYLPEFLFFTIFDPTPGVYRDGLCLSSYFLQCLIQYRWYTGMADFPILDKCVSSSGSPRIPEV
jgi:hypothetical protein